MRIRGPRGSVMIKSLVIVLSVLAMPIALAPSESGEREKYSILAIKYIGESDKPIMPVVISDSDAGANWYRDAVLRPGKWKLTYLHVVDSALLEKLVTAAETFELSLRREQGNASKLASAVSVTITTPRGKKTFLYDAESAVSQLDSLQKHCEGDESLRADLLHFRMRIPRSEALLGELLFCNQCRA